MVFLTINNINFNITIIIIAMKQQPKKVKIIKKEQIEPVQAAQKGKKITLQQLPTIQNMMEIDPQNRTLKTQDYFLQVKPFLHQFMQKKVGSRVLQLMFKWGSEQVKKSIQKSIVKHWKDLIKSKYALYLISNVGKTQTFAGALEDAVILQSSYQGAKVVEHYIETAGQEGLKQVKNKFYQLWEKSKNNDLKAQQTLHNITLKVIEKQSDSLPISKLILRLSLSSMFAEEKQKVLEYLIAKVNEWIGDEQGARLFFEVINNADPKQKKQIVRSFKGHVRQIIDLNNPAYVTLIKLLTQVDDTVLVNKLLLPQIEELYPLMSTKKHAFSIIFSLFSPRNHNFNILGKYEHTVLHTECKKTEQIRKSEIRKELYMQFLNFLEGQNLYHLLRHHVNNKIIIAVYKSLQEDGQTQMYNSFITKLAKYFLTDAKEALKNKTFSQSLTADPNANKIIKSILILNETLVDFYCDEFSKLAIKNLNEFLNNKSSFVLLGLIEKGGRQYLLDEIKKSRIKLDSVVAGNHYVNLVNKK